MSLNLLSSHFFIVLLPRWQSSGVFFFFAHAFVHFFVMFLACYFGFFFPVFLLGLLQAFLGWRLFSRVSGLLRALFGVNTTMLSIPLVLSFALLLGLRAVVNVPVFLGANWAFRLTEKRDIHSYISGLRKAIFLLYLVPLFAFLCADYAVLWDPKTAIQHCLFGLTVSVLVMEVLFFRFLKIPFACSYLPGKEKIQLYWLVYLIGFIAYLNTASRIEVALLRSPSHFIYFFAAIFLVIMGIRAYQFFYLYRRSRIQYEEQPEPVMIDLNYCLPSHKHSSV